MKFERLSSSMALNSREQPSIYMALCMVESLFKDVELAAGTEFSHAAPGDEQLPTKLVWLARTLLKVYGENSENLQRNRDRLEKMMEKVRQAETELQGQEKLAGELAALRQRDEALEQQLAEAEERRQETEALQSRCTQAKARLLELEGFDPAAAKLELARLEAQLEKRAGQTAELKAALERQTQSNRRLELECDELRQRSAESLARRDELDQEMEAAQREMEDCRRELEDSDSRVTALKTAKERMIEELTETRILLAELQKENEAYRSGQLDPVIAQRQQQLAENEAIKRQLEAKNQDWESAVKDRTRLKLRLEEAEKRASEAQAEVEQSLRRTREAEKKADVLQTQKEEALRQLESLQQEIEDYETGSIPELRGLIQSEEENREELRRQLEEGQRRKDSLGAELVRLREEDAARQQQLAELKQLHSDLTSGLQAKTQELNALKQKVKELEGKSVREQEMAFRHQLEEDLAALESSERACVSLNQQLREGKERLQRQRTQLEELQQQKRETERTEREVTEKLQVLLPFRDPKLRQQVQELQNRQKLLSDTNERLEKSMDLMREVLDEPPEMVSLDPEGLRDALKKCGEALGHLQGSLVRCANAASSELKLQIHMEE